MATTFDSKLLALGAAGRTRLSKAWADPEQTTDRIQAAFGFHRGDIARLKSLIGPRPVVQKLKQCAPSGLGRGA